MQKILWRAALSTALCAQLALCASPPARAAADASTVESQSAAAWVGKTAAPFKLPGTDGKQVDVGRALGKRPVVLVFYRGVW
jgi:hypothetical protein